MDFGLGMIRTIDSLTSLSSVLSQTVLAKMSADFVMYCSLCVHVVFMTLPFVGFFVCM